VVSTEEGKAFAESRGCLFVECSAKKGEGVNGAFDDLVNQVSGRDGRELHNFNSLTRSLLLSDNINAIAVAKYYWKKAR